MEIHLKTISKLTSDGVPWIIGSYMQRCFTNEPIDIGKGDARWCNSVPTTIRDNLRLIIVENSSSGEGGSYIIV